MQVEYSITESAIGRLLVARTIDGICGLKFADADYELILELRQEFPKADFERVERLNEVDSVDAYLRGDLKEFDFSLDVSATAFQERVWEMLRLIPYGETISYGELAKRIGKPKASRAIASACAKNRVALVIPCHRVVGANGSLSGFRWGIERKRKLIEGEQERVSLF